MAYFIISSIVHLIMIVEAYYHCHKKPKYQLEVLYEWTTLDYKWPPWISSVEMQRQGRFIPQNNAMFAMEAFLGDVFVNVGRGSPSTRYSRN